MTRTCALLALWCWLLPGAITAEPAAAPIDRDKKAASNTSPFLQAEWIAPPTALDPLNSLPLFRKEFTVKSQPRRATLRIVGLGDYDARVNGRRLTEIGINQPWSQYEKTLYYRDFDVTPLVRRGLNCVGVMLANSFWHNPNPPRGRYNKDGPQRTAYEPLLLCAELLLEQKDGTLLRLGTDSSWRTSDGPIAFSHIFAGEDFDARRQRPGWDSPRFDASSWQSARSVPAPKSRLIPQHWAPFKIMERFSPLAIKTPTNGVSLYCFPQNCSAQLRVELEGGKPGDRVTFRCGEHKNAQDQLFGGYTVSCAVVTDGRPLTQQWLSFYLGMQFVEVTGAVPQGQPNPHDLPVVRAIELVHVRTGLADAGAFSCSSDLFNRTHRLINWAMRANTSYVLSDCPHREKLGWLECAYLLAPSFQYRYDCRDWFDKILRDIRDAQEPSGRVLTVAPSYPAGRFPGAFNFTVEWGAAAVLLPWHQYLWSGDRQVLRENFDLMRRFTDFIQSQAKDGLAPGGLGDWYDYGHGQPPGPSRFTPTQLSATATWALCALTVSRAAEILALPEESRQLPRVARADRRRFSAPFPRSRHGQTQTSRQPPMRQRHGSLCRYRPRGRSFSLGR